MLRLIKMTTAHLEKAMRWRMLPEVTRYSFTDPQLTMHEQSAWFEKISVDSTSIYWVINYEANDIGVLDICDIDRHNLRCGWGYYIGETAYRGRGIARNLECNIYDFVFEQLHMNKLWCEVLANNQKVVEIHKKYGSEVEGVLKEHIIKQGKVLDVVKMGITRNKWMHIRDKVNYERIDIEN
ncbi:UDP-4-amino-4,6-dideoxy-N-acetyl-beta-L-altrosamine N-acetyltransferase [Syntrophomonas wolfei]|jgi:hypothetical protein|uniref:UDP-4-amino-4, 6-dideoxy-N-acetyl-beta-L-altrosamine N-acetyltransferase n=1 Tax=Syntrophomonas wolfei TaxID=863 RepID=UPI0023F117CF|nr:UDP-4-amino-4,6-dideoxy-N-acetyl-beta-L-altrosamine N-acetyltransferase [Syntrophomonas wolfei]